MTPTTAHDRTAALMGRLLLTRAQVAELLGCDDEVTVGNLHRLGRLRAVKVGRCCMWKPSDVREFVEGLKVES